MPKARDRLVIAYGYCEHCGTSLTKCMCVADVTDSQRIARDIYDHLVRFVAFPSEHYAISTALWVLHAHTVDTAESTPRLAFLSPEPGSGKSRALEVLATLVPRPMEAVNATPAALFRSVGDDSPPTILFDEIDTIFGPKAKEHEEVRGFLNAGHRRGAVAYRCVGPTQTVTPFPAYCAVALAGLHDLPDTLAQRSIIVPMRRRAPSETVEPFRGRIHRPEGYALAQRLAEWAEINGKHLVGYVPQMPPGVTDRPADVWEPILAIADLIGGDWPERARAACAHIANATIAREPSLNVRLLSDLRALYEANGDPTFMATREILEGLHAMEEAPWASYATQGLTARHLSSRLRGYGIERAQERMGESVLKGYRRNDLADSWSRYLPASLPVWGFADTSDTSATSLTNPVADTTLASSPIGYKAPQSATDSLPSTRDVAVVALVSDSREPEGRCLGCGLPMEADYLGDGCHPTCQPKDAA